MKKISFHILRLGLGITFLWIGVLIFKAPEAWGGFLQPWAARLLPVPVVQAMLATAVLDMVVGLWLLIGVRVWLAALLGTAHLVVVLIGSGITEVTIRDVGLLAASLTLMLETMPLKIFAKFSRAPQK